MNSRRDLLKTVGAGMLLKLMPVGAFAADQVKFVDVRLWPADEYTRVTLEHAGAIKYKHFLIENPWRMVIDLLDMRLDNTLKDLTSRLHPEDPYVQQIRVGQYDANTVRLVFDLKAEVKPEIFTIDPIAEYQNRFVVDFYPKNPADPLLALLKKSEDPAMREDEISRALRLAESETNGTLKLEGVAPEKGASKTEVAKAQPNAPVEKKPAPELRRMITVAIDPGHGGEDPGAIGPGGTFEKDVVLQIAQRLRQRINATQVNGHQLRAFMTRDADFFVPLHVRVDKARRVQADLFVSLHADAFYTPRPQGASVYALSTRGASSATIHRTSSRASRWSVPRIGQVRTISPRAIASSTCARVASAAGSGRSSPRTRRPSRPTWPAAT